LAVGVALVLGFDDVSICAIEHIEVGAYIQFARISLRDGNLSHRIAVAFEKGTGDLLRMFRCYPAPQ
jgi:hypothetical protein